VTQIEGFPPISRPNARILVLGSMPSSESLRQQQYYAHPRNSFWPIISRLLNIDDEGYQQRADAAMAEGMAIWDVCKACFRSGSLDSAIDDRTIVPNDFHEFFDDHPAIGRVLFNGAKAEQVFRKWVWPTLTTQQQAFTYLRMPSTSPANAGKTVAQKQVLWAVGLGVRGEG
jgi:hypoxanthine-DNA glycosylase